MDNHWHNRNSLNKKRHTLHSVGAGFVFFVLLYLITKIFSFSLCPIKNFLGFQCFGCGLTRGFISILHLDFKSACEYNILSIPLFISIFLYSVLSIVDFIFNTNHIEKIETQLAKKYMYILYVAILATSSILNNR